VQIFFFLESLEQQRVEASEQVPVEIAKVVARRIFTMIGEFNPAPVCIVRRCANNEPETPAGR